MRGWTSDVALLEVWPCWQAEPLEEMSKPELDVSMFILPVARSWLTDLLLGPGGFDAFFLALPHVATGTRGVGESGLATIRSNAAWMHASFSDTSGRIQVDQKGEQAQFACWV